MYIIRQPILFFIVLFVILVLAACGSTKPTSQPIIQAKIKLEPTASRTIQPTFTTTPKAPKTPTLTETLDATYVAYLTYLAPTYEAERVMLQLTKDAKSILAAQFQVICIPEYDVFLSPDGNWFASTCLGFEIINRDGQKIPITHKEISPPDVEIYGVLPLYWSQDSQYLYFATRFCCADTDAYGSLGALYRLDLQDSTWAEIIDHSYFNYYSFSPTGRRLLHIPDDQAGAGRPVKFHIIDLKTGSEQWFSLENFEQAGNVVWSEDGQSFIITAQIGNIYQDTVQTASFRISLDDLSITNIRPFSQLPTALSTP